MRPLAFTAVLCLHASFTPEFQDLSTAAKRARSNESQNPKINTRTACGSASKGLEGAEEEEEEAEEDEEEQEEGAEEEVEDEEKEEEEIQTSATRSVIKTRRITRSVM